MLSGESVAMASDPRTTMAVEQRTSSDSLASSSEASVTHIHMDTSNMTLEQLLNQFEMVQNITNEEIDILKEQHWRVAVIAIYSVVILLGFLENMAIMCVLLKNRHLHTPTNIFIMGLALSDILLCSFNLPLQLHYQITDQWVFGGGLCRVIMSTSSIPVFVSSLSILMIAIDRYMLIVHPFRKRMSKLTAVGIVISIAVLTTILSIPIIKHMEYHVIDVPALQLYQSYCVERWTNLKLRHIYTVSMLLIQFFVPLIATSLIYLQISNVLSKRPIKKNERRRNHKTNKILITIVLFFSLCWLPWNLFVLLLEFNNHIISGRYIKLCDLLLKIFAMGSACINPFLYGWLNDNFRKELHIMVSRGRKDRIRQNGHTYTLAEQSKTDFCEKYTTAM